ncbi:MAG: TraX family protein [Oscillospiraceae bacterium]
MSTFTIKIIALVLMFIDHFGTFFPVIAKTFYLRQIGRLSFPLFLFCLAVGVKHTSNPKKYVQRLYLASAIMGIGNFALSLIIPYSPIYCANNIFPTMMYIAFFCFIDMLMQRDSKQATKPLLVFGIFQVVSYLVDLYAYEKFGLAALWLVRGVLPNIFTTEYGAVFIFLGFILYKFSDSKINLSISYTTFCALYFIMSFERFFPVLTTRMVFITEFEWLIILSLPIMLLYNGKRGYSGKWGKYLFYIFYPIHFWLLFIISNLVK